ncbi:MAG: O-antigen ligase family protein [Bacteroidales bacterium]|nr:O-antigen ligase family protein [Bacteroidales bacterium]
MERLNQILIKLFRNHHYNQALIILIFLSTFLFPVFRFSSKMPYIDLLDLILPLLFISIWIERKHLKSRFALVVLAFAAYILLTIIINGRLSAYRDYFEILKLLKFLIVFVFIFLHISPDKFHKYIIAVFIAVAVFNLFHFYNILNFNEFLRRYYYTSDIHISLFGLNSLGQPATKRMLGTLGNPNNNAVIFLFFSCFFLMNPHKEKLIHKFFFLIAYTGIVLCQSRTGVISFLGIYILHFFLAPFNIRDKIFQFGAMALIFFIIFEYSSSDYIASLASGQDIIETGSARGRLETWTYLWEMIRTKPIFGHAPFKEYFYENGLYSESEYMLMLWRYGIIGLFLYFLMLIQPAFIAFFKYRKEKNSHFLILFTGVIFITALTNNPMNNPVINITFAIALAYWAKSVQQREIISLNNGNKQI